MSDKLISLLLTFIIFFTPLAFGTVHLWAKTVLGISILVVFYIHLLGSIRKGAIEYSKNRLNIFFTLFIFYTLLQLTLKTTLSPYNTYTALITLILYFILFLVITSYAGDRRDIDGMILKIMLAGFFAATLGILQFMTGTTQIYWVKEFKNRIFFSSFLYDNHFACYISMVSLLTLGKFSAILFEERPIKQGAPLKQIFLNALDNALNKKILFVLFLLVIMVTALFLSGSRAGILFFLTSAIIFIIFTLSIKPAKKIVWIVIYCLIVTCLLLSWIGTGTLMYELNSIFCYEKYSGRLDKYIDALKILKDHPLTGIGLDAFPNIFPMYREGPAPTFYKYLHNDILQSLIELGLLGFFLLVIPLLSFLMKLITEVRRTRDTYKCCIGLGMLAIFLYLALHISIDFGLHAGAISVLLIILLAISSSLMNLGIRTTRVLFKIKRKEVKLFAYIFSTIGFICLSFILAKPLIADIIIEKKPSLSSFSLATKLDPGNDNIYFRKYQFLVAQIKKGSNADEDIALETAKIAIDKALELNPHKTIYIIAKGELSLWNKNYSVASSLFKEAAMSEPYNPLIQMVYSYSLLWQGIYERDTNKKEALLKKGLIYYSIATNLDAGFTLRSTMEDEASYILLKGLLRKEGIDIQ